VVLLAVQVGDLGVDLAASPVLTVEAGAGLIQGLVPARVLVPILVLAHAQRAEAPEASHVGHTQRAQSAHPAEVVDPLPALPNQRKWKRKGKQNIGAQAAVQNPLAGLLKAGAQVEVEVEAEARQGVGVEVEEVV